jgi:serine phosphatase RsbU (regulator of sigma subunit)
VTVGLINSIPIASFSFTLLIIGVAGIIANQFINDRNKVDELLTTLEIKNINLNRLYESTLDINAQVSLASSNINILSNIILDYACKFANARLGSLMLLDRKKNVLIIKAVYGKRSDSTELIGKEIAIEENSPSSYVIKTQKALMVNNDNINQEIREGIKHNEHYKTNSFIIEPLIYNQEIFGCINITNKIDTTFFTEDDISLLNAFSAAASVIIQNVILNKNLIHKKKLEKEMELAKRIQTAILPKQYKSPNFDIAGIMVPAEEVGGDYFDFIVDNNDREWFCIGDVSSHGLTPGLIMMMAQSIINTLIISKRNTPANVINYLNKVLFENIRNRLNSFEFMTISIIAHNGNGKMILAGKHEIVIIYRKKTNHIETFLTEGVWVGLLPKIKDLTTNITFSLDSGDILLLYTDGVIEASNKNKEQFDINRLSQVLLDNSNKTPEEILKIILERVNNFMEIQKDDITLMAIRRK